MGPLRARLVPVFAMIYLSAGSLTCWGCTYTMLGRLAEAGRNLCRRCHNHREALAPGLRVSGAIQETLPEQIEIP